MIKKSSYIPIGLFKHLVIAVFWLLKSSFREELGCFERLYWLNQHTALYFLQNLNHSRLSLYDEHMAGVFRAMKMRDSLWFVMI